MTRFLKNTHSQQKNTLTPFTLLSHKFVRFHWHLSLKSMKKLFRIVFTLQYAQIEITKEKKRKIEYLMFVYSK